jgi:hypothetical protein
VHAELILNIHIVDEESEEWVHDESELITYSVNESEQGVGQGGASLVAVAAPGLRIGGGHLMGKLIFGRGQDIIFKKVLLLAHAVVTGHLSPPQEIRPPLKRGRYS